MVLRPTVNCNQDCLFCSANETSGNVWTSSDAMLRQIARAARRGVQRVALSGGEPTLDKNLPHYVAAARRLGVPEVELVTNGTLLDRPARVQALAQAGLTHAFVSLHAHDEALSRRITQKRGDFARTVAAIEGLIERGVKTAINHVITSRNYRFLPDFVSFARERFAGRAGISFALVTPQYKALEHLELMPRMRDVRPWLERALERAIAIGQPAWVGSRQGIPPCQLGPHRALSDVLEHPEAARTEDAPQKVKAQVCERCRYRQVCTGVWKPYAARYGLEELVPFEGPPITQAERDEVWARKTEPWGLLSEVPSFLLDPVSAERELASESKLDGDGGGSDPQDYLPIHTRPFRVLLIGTGPRGRAIARTLGEGLALAAVCSPHAVEGDPELGGCPSYRDVHEALEGARPDAVIVAAPAGAHDAILRIAIEHACSSRAPILCTRPFESEAMAELAQARGVPLWVAHETLALPWPRGERLEATLCVTGIGAWGRRAIEACVEDALAIAWRVLGPEGAQPIRASFTGDSRPESLRVELARGELTLRFADDGRLARSAPQGTVQGALRGSVQIDGERIGLETGVHRLGPALRASLDAGAASTFAAAPEAIRIAQAARRATELCGAPFDRKGAPKHVASAGLR
ncbi:MAG: radical SAM protein [Sandaracinaceae bacterium]|nr:radical SAM protein [Sandaracinaceae bacterium]